MNKAYYSYDPLGRLTLEDNLWLNKTFRYYYDAGGNILSKEEYARGASGTEKKSISYTYGNSQWKDQLTEYDGYSILYDRMGNPVTYRNGWKMTWERGRLLKSVSLTPYRITYDYNADGKRVKTQVYQSDNSKRRVNTSGMAIRLWRSQITVSCYNSPTTRMGIRSLYHREVILITTSTIFRGM